MEWLFGFAVVAGMVLLRIVVPILVMVLVIWGLRRLNARWEAEASEERVQERAHRQQPSGAPVLERGPSAGVPSN